MYGNRYFAGMSVNSPQGIKMCHAILLLACVDLPAQAKMINMKSHNGKVACAHCEDEGVPRASCHLSGGSRISKRGWKYSLAREPMTTIKHMDYLYSRIKFCTKGVLVRHALYLQGRILRVFM